jgi:hypothetical protein
MDLARLSQFRTSFIERINLDLRQLLNFLSPNHPESREHPLTDPSSHPENQKIESLSELNNGQQRQENCTTPDPQQAPKLNFSAEISSQKYATIRHAVTAGCLTIVNGPESLRG